MFSLTNVLAEGCNLDVSLINQDPYPATPGDYVKIVFQVDGVSNPECGTIEFELLEQYPLIFDPGQETKITIESGVYQKDYNSFLIAPYKVRLDIDALNGDNPIEVRYKQDSLTSTYLTKEFDINVKDVRADFEIFVKDYNSQTKEMTFQILNTAESDIQALTLEIPQQETVNVKGSKTIIVGDLDSNEYTTATFEATSKGGEIKLNVSYTDETNTRRTLEKTVLFEPEYFQDRTNGKAKTPITSYLFWVLLIGIIVFYFYRRWRKKKKAKHERQHALMNPKK